MPHSRKFRPGVFLRRLAFWIVLLFVLCVLLIPIYYMFSSGFKTNAQMLDMEQFFFFEPTLHTFEKVLSAYDILTPLKNSLVVSLTATALACLMGLPAAYAIARHNMHHLSSIILIVRIIPAISFLSPGT